MLVAKGAVDADILINSGVTSILHMPRNAMFCKPCMNPVIILPLILSIWMSFHCHRYQFLLMNHEVMGEASQTNVVTFECGNICTNQR